jgi:hypothetical protein
MVVCSVTTRVGLPGGPNTLIGIEVGSRSSAPSYWGRKVRLGSAAQYVSVASFVILCVEKSLTIRVGGGSSDPVIVHRLVDSHQAL